MPIENAAKEFTAQMKCSHCMNNVHMETLFTHSGVRPYSDGPNEWEAGSVFELCKCPACEKLMLRSYAWHNSMDPSDISYENLYPSKNDLRGLPLKINTALKAAQKVRTIDANAYGVLVGRVLDLVCEDRSATGKTLDQRLKNLATKGEIPLKLVDVATGLRRLRNIGAHADLGELTEQDLPVLDNLARAILEYVYTAPLIAKEAEKRWSALKGETSLEVSAA